MSVKGPVHFVLYILWLINCFLQRATLMSCSSSGSKEGEGRNQDLVPLTEGPMHWPHLKASHGWAQSRGKAAVVCLHKCPGSGVYSTRLNIRLNSCRAIADFLWGSPELLRWGQHRPQGLHPQKGHHWCPHKHPSHPLSGPAAGRNTGAQAEQLPGLLVDYSHLLPSSTECAHQENMSQWLACCNPLFWQT